MDKCSNCKNRAFYGFNGVELCMWYEMTNTEEDEIREADHCCGYERGTPSCMEDENYCKSATAGDYSPSCPWNAEGMSIRDFI